MDIFSLDKFWDAFAMMLMGLTVVFIVLVLVIVVGNALIKFVNKFCPEEEKPVAKAAVSAAPSAAGISPEVRTAIDLAVEKMFGGKAMVQKVEKI